MLCEKRLIIAENMIVEFLKDKENYPTLASINEGSCGEFTHLVNEAYSKAGLKEHTVYSTFDFISSSADGLCEYMKDWKEESLLDFGVTLEYFESYRKKVESIDKRGVVGYHVWLYDGVHHYDSSCLDGVKNPLELPFFQQFINK